VITSHRDSGAKLQAPLNCPLSALWISTQAKQNVSFPAYNSITRVAHVLLRLCCAPLPQATLDVLPAEKQRQLTQSHQRTTATIAAMRQTLHDEHSCLVQVSYLRMTPLTSHHAGSPAHRSIL